MIYPLFHVINPPLPTPVPPPPPNLVLCHFSAVPCQLRTPPPILLASNPVQNQVTNQAMLLRTFQLRFRVPAHPSNPPIALQDNPVQNHRRSLPTSLLLHLHTSPVHCRLGIDPQSTLLYPFAHYRLSS